MAKTTINISLLQKGRLKDGIKKIQNFENSLPQKCEQFVSELASEGIHIANMVSYGDGLGAFVMFQKKIQSPTKYGCKAIMYGQDLKTVTRDYYSINEAKQVFAKHVEISPILMLEYGSGVYADVSKSSIATSLPHGRGTFPNPSKNKKGIQNAFNPNGWYYMDLDNVWHHSYGINPSAPMHNAYLQMQLKQIEIAEKVFVW